MLENKMYKKLKQGIGSKILLQRIENRTGIVPDIYFASTRNSGWIELKNIKIVSGMIIKIPFRPGQYSWIKKHIRYNDNIHLIGTIDNTWFIKTGVYIKETYNINDLFFCSTVRFISLILSYLNKYV